MSEGTSPDYVRSFGMLLKRLRIAQDLTQEELAERAGVSVYSISNIERDVPHVPRKDTLQLLAQALDLSAEDAASFLAAARSRPRAAATSPPAASTHAALPTLPTPLIGRAEALAAVSAVLRDEATRLLTLTGPPGVGKTSVALAVAAAQADRYPGGCVWVPLAALRDPALLPDSISRALKLRRSGSQPVLDVLKTWLHGKRLLMLLDNFEQIAPAARDVAELLAACPSLTCLVTSRVPLRLRGEQVYSVDPLPTPAIDELPPALARNDAVSLFLQRARDVQPGLTLTPANAATVAAICRRLDGLPLALELAASRLSLLSLRDLSSRLEHTLPLLTDGPRDLLPHQRTLRSTLAWSYTLLTPHAQAALRRLAVFVDGSTLEAAEAICADVDPAGAGNPAALGDLAQLVDHHLVRRVDRAREADPSEGGVRLSMLETIHDYAWELLLASDECAATERAYARYYLSFAEHAAAAAQGSERERWLAQLEVDQGNTRAALAWAVRCEELEIGLRLALALGQYWEHMGSLSEGRAWLDRLLTLAIRAGGSVAPKIHAAALALTARFALWQGDVESASIAFESARAMTEGSDDAERQSTLSAALNGLGIIAKIHSQYAEAMGYLQRSLALRRALNDPQGIVASLMNIGSVERRYGDIAVAKGYFTECAARYRALGDQQGEATALGSLGNIAKSLGQVERAAELLQACLQALRQVGEPRDIAMTLFNLSDVLRLRQEIAQGITLCHEGIALSLRHDLKFALVVGLESCAALLADSEDVGPSVELLSAAAAIRRAHDLPLEPDDQSSIDEVMTQLRVKLGDESVTQRWSAAFVAPEAIVEQFLINQG